MREDSWKMKPEAGAWQWQCSILFSAKEPYLHAACMLSVRRFTLLFNEPSSQVWRSGSSQSI